MSTSAGASADTDAPEPDPTRRRFGPGVVLTAALLALLVGVSLGFLAPMLGRPGDDSAEAGFLRDMSTHHAQAVEMAMIAHAGTEVPDIRTLSNDIALTQHGQISIMQTWLQKWDLGPTGTRAPMAWMPDAAGSVRNGLMPGMATPEQLMKLRAATGKELNVQFLTLMRSHHLGGIHMAQEITNLSDNDDVNGLAGTMVSSQQGEISLIQTLLDQAQKAS